MFDLTAYTIIAEWFPRLLGLVYFFAFAPFLFQIKGLIGENGILPVREFLEFVQLYRVQNNYYTLPTLFWIDCSDLSLMLVTAAGTAFSLLLFCGFMPTLMLFLLYVFYLSIVNAGQDFLGFGWEGLLLETTAHAFFLSMTTVPNPMIWFSLNFLLFRFHVQAGLVKLQSRDPSWRNLTAVAYHYQTQPLPNIIAWYVHKLPLWFHKTTCIIMFLIEIAFPFGIFGNENMRLIVFGGLFSLQFLIWFTGNFSYLNYLTAVLCTILLNNASLSMVFGNPALSPSATPLWLEVFITICGVPLFALQFMRGWQQLQPNRLFGKALRASSSYHLANGYGIFAVMTTKRYEIVLEGSDDGLIWKEYTYRYKPSESSRRPRWIAPYQPRIDWQTWFLPFTNFKSAHWFQSFIGHLLKGTPAVTKLLRGNPFPDHPPKYMRALVYEYVFSSFDEKKHHGWWWRRRFLGHYTPTVSLA